MLPLRGEDERRPTLALMFILGLSVVLTATLPFACGSDGGCSNRAGIHTSVGWGRGLGGASQQERQCQEPGIAAVASSPPSQTEAKAKTATSTNKSSAASIPMPVAGSAATTGAATPSAVSTATSVPVSGGRRSSTQGRIGRHISSTPSYVQKERRYVLGSGRGAVAAGLGSPCQYPHLRRRRGRQPSWRRQRFPLPYEGRKKRPGLRRRRRMRSSPWHRRPREETPPRGGRPSYCQHEFLDVGRQHRICRQCQCRQ